MEIKRETIERRIKYLHGYAERLEKVRIGLRSEVQISIEDVAAGEIDDLCHELARIQGGIDEISNMLAEDIAEPPPNQIDKPVSPR